MQCKKHLLPGAILKSKNYGEFKVLKYIKNTNRAYIIFLKTGFETTADRRIISTGNVRDPFYPRVYGVGFSGVGEHEPKDNDSLPYRAWHYMLRRCYGKGFLDRGDTVCDEWKNFQNFAGWYNDNKVAGKILMNKEGEHVYSPANSVFDYRDNNSLFLSGEEYEVKNPQGKVFKFKNMAKFCREHGLRAANLSVVISGKQKQHKGWVGVSMDEEERKSLCSYSRKRKSAARKEVELKEPVKLDREEDRFKSRTQKIVPNKLSDTDIILNKFFGIG